MNEAMSTPKGGTMKRVKRPRKLAMPEERCRKPTRKANKRNEEKIELDNNAADLELARRERCDTDELIDFCFPERKGKKGSDADSGLEPSPKRKRRSRPRSSIELYIQAANTNIGNGGGGDYNSTNNKN